MDIKTLVELASLNYWPLYCGNRTENISQRIIDHIHIVHPGLFTNGYRIHVEGEKGKEYITVSDTSKPILHYAVVGNSDVVEIT